MTAPLKYIYWQSNRRLSSVHLADPYIPAVLTACKIRIPKDAIIKKSNEIPTELIPCRICFGLKKKR